MTQEGSTLTIFDSSRTWGVMCIHGQGPILTISQNHAVTTIHSTETFDGQNNARPDTWNGRRPPCATHGLHRNLHPPPSASQRATLPAGNQIAGSETRRRLNQQRGNRPPGPRCSRASICAGWAVAASHACCSQLPRFGADASDCLGAGWSQGQRSLTWTPRRVNRRYVRWAFWRAAGRYEELDGRKAKGRCEKMDPWMEESMEAMCTRYSAVRVPAAGECPARPSRPPPPKPRLFLPVLPPVHSPAGALCGCPGSNPPMGPRDASEFSTLPHWGGKTGRAAPRSLGVGTGAAVAPAAADCGLAVRLHAIGARGSANCVPSPSLSSSRGSCTRARAPRNLLGAYCLVPCPSF